jgi:hypothetical protein
MERSLLVRIFVPTRDDRGGDGRGEVGVTGTGYPVGPDLVLTARHVIAPPDRDRNYPIEVLWYYHPEAGPDEGWYKLPKDDDCVVWRSAGNLDAALLRSPRPPGVRGCGFVSREQSRDGEWSSMGFPRAAKTAKERAPARPRPSGELAAAPGTGGVHRSRPRGRELDERRGSGRGPEADSAFRPQKAL